MNVKLLEQVRDFIKYNPEEYAQESWCQCISGLALVLSGAVMRPDDFFSPLPALLLGLDEEQAKSLFYVSGWPKQLAGDLLDAYRVGDKQGAAAAAVARIDHLLAGVAVEQEAAYV